MSSAYRRDRGVYRRGELVGLLRAAADAHDARAALGQLEALVEAQLARLGARDRAERRVARLDHLDRVVEDLRRALGLAAPTLDRERQREPVEGRGHERI